MTVSKSGVVDDKKMTRANSSQRRKRGEGPGGGAAAAARRRTVSSCSSSSSSFVAAAAAAAATSSSSCSSSASYSRGLKAHSRRRRTETQMMKGGNSSSSFRNRQRIHVRAIRCIVIQCDTPPGHLTLTLSDEQQHQQQQQQQQLLEEEDIVDGKRTAQRQHGQDDNQEKVSDTEPTHQPEEDLETAAAASDFDPFGLTKHRHRKRRGRRRRQRNPNHNHQYDGDYYYKEERHVSRKSAHLPHQSITNTQQQHGAVNVYTSPKPQDAHDHYDDKGQDDHNDHDEVQVQPPEKPLRNHLQKRRASSSASRGTGSSVIVEGGVVGELDSCFSESLYQKTGGSGSTSTGTNDNGSAIIGSAATNGAFPIACNGADVQPLKEDVTTDDIDDYESVGGCVQTSGVILHHHHHHHDFTETEPPLPQKKPKTRQHLEKVHDQPLGVDDRVSTRSINRRERHSLSRPSIGHALDNDFIQKEQRKKKPQQLQPNGGGISVVRSEQDKDDRYQQQHPQSSHLATQTRTPSTQKMKQGRRPVKQKDITSLMVEKKLKQLEGFVRKSTPSLQDSRTTAGDDDGGGGGGGGGGAGPISSHGNAQDARQTTMDLANTNKKESRKSTGGRNVGTSAGDDADHHDTFGASGGASSSRNGKSRRGGIGRRVLSVRRTFRMLFVRSGRMQRLETPPEEEEEEDDHIL